MIWRRVWLLMILINASIPAWVRNSDEQVSISLDTVVVTATKTDLDPELVPFSYYSVTKEDDRKRPNTCFSNFGEMVRDLPGVNDGQFYPWGMAWIQLRGTSNGVNRTVHMVDGLSIHVYQAYLMRPF